MFYGDEIGMEGIGNLMNRRPYSWNRKDKKLRKFIKKMLRLRNKNQFLKTADMNLIQVDREKLVFERVEESNSIFVIVSRTHVEITLNLPEEYYAKYWLGEKIAWIGDSSLQKIVPYGAIAMKI